MRRLLQEWYGVNDLLNLDRSEITDPYLLTRLRARVRRKRERPATIVLWLRRSFVPALTAQDSIQIFLRQIAEDQTQLDRSTVEHLVTLRPHLDER